VNAWGSALAIEQPDLADDRFGELRIFDSSNLPDNPPIESFYRHRVPLVRGLRQTWKNREVMWALAERDIRASYKQAALGMGWALLSPVIQIVLFSLLFSHIKAFKVPGVPYAIYAYTGLLCWSYFAGSLSAGGNSIIGSIALLNKTQFPRECFPLAQMLEQSLYTIIGLVPLAILMLAKGFTPHWQVVWVPVFVAIELVFASGLTLLFAASVVYVRDLSQVTSIITSLGLFATPVIWPFVKISNVTFGPLHHVDLRPYYSFFNPLAPVMDSARRTFLQGLQPDWSWLGIGAVSAALYFVIGYTVFKRLEVGFADIS
jgi:lipopolysaccharide transport system permease protein